MGEGSSRGRGVWQGEGGRGHFSSAAIDCTTTWCFAPRDFAQIREALVLDPSMAPPLKGSRLTSPQSWEGSHLP